MGVLAVGVPIVAQCNVARTPVIGETAVVAAFAVVEALEERGDVAVVAIQALVAQAALLVAEEKAILRFPPSILPAEGHTAHVHAQFLIRIVEHLLGGHSVAHKIHQPQPSPVIWEAELDTGTLAGSAHEKHVAAVFQVHLDLWDDALHVALHVLAALELAHLVLAVYSYMAHAVGVGSRGTVDHPPQLAYEGAGQHGGHAPAGGGNQFSGVGCQSHHTVHALSEFQVPLGICRHGGTYPRATTTSDAEVIVNPGIGKAIGIGLHLERMGAAYADAGRAATTSVVIGRFYS